MTYLINAVNTYRVATVEDAEELHETLKKDPRFELMAFSRTTKQIKAKGEVIEEYQVCKAKLTFTEEKSPDACFEVEYNEI